VVDADDVDAELRHAGGDLIGVLLFGEVGGEARVNAEEAVAVGAGVQVAVAAGRGRGETDCITRGFR
jgi:hypothetical protein